jgi:hypothetical protein
MVGKPSMTAAVARTNSADRGCRVVSEMLYSSLRRVIISRQRAYGADK